MASKKVVAITAFVGLLFLLATVIYIINNRSKQIRIVRMEALSNGYNIGDTTMLRDSFCVYNHQCKTRRELRHEIQTFDALATTTDSVLKYNALLARYFYLEGNGLTKNFYDPSDLEKIMDYSNQLCLSIKRKLEYYDGIPYMCIYVDGEMYRIRFTGSIEWNKILDTRLLTEDDK